MMKIGICSVTFREKSSEEIIEIAKNCELNYIERGSDIHLPKGKIDIALELRKKCENNNIDVSYGSYYKFLTDDFEEYAKTAQALGAKNIRVRAKRKRSKEFSKQEYDDFIKLTKENSKIAKNYGLNICFENHRKSFTDNRYSCITMLKDIDKDNVFLYRQPQSEETVEERIETIKFLNPFLKTIHVFQRDENFNRFPLEQGKLERKKYANELGKDRPYLLEFVKNDSIEQLKKDIKVLKEVLE